MMASFSWWLGVGAVSYSCCAAETISACSAAGLCSRCCSSVRYSPATAAAVAAGFTGGGGGTGGALRLVQPSAVSSASTASAPRGRLRARVRASGCMRLRLGYAAHGGAIAARGADRHGDAEVRAGELPVEDLHVAAVCRYRRRHHREPDAGALDRRALRGTAGVESLEHVATVLRRDPRAAVGDVEQQLRVGGVRPQVDRAALGRILC